MGFNSAFKGLISCLDCWKVYK